MSDEPIFDDLRAAVQAGERLADHARTYVTSHLHRHDSAATPAAAQPERHQEMSTLAEIADRWKADIEADIEKGKAKLEQDLPVVAQFASAAASNPLVAAGLNILHLSPEFLTGVANELLAADAKLAAAKQAQAEADAAQAAALAAAAPPEPAPAEEVPAA